MLATCPPEVARTPAPAFPLPMETTWTRPARQTVALNAPRVVPGRLRPVRSFPRVPLITGVVTPVVATEASQVPATGPLAEIGTGLSVGNTLARPWSAVP